MQDRRDLQSRAQAASEGSPTVPEEEGMTPARQPSIEEHRNIVLRTSADVLENAAAQVAVLAEEWPEYGDDARRFARFSQRVSAAASQVGHKPRKRF